MSDSQVARATVYRNIAIALGTVGGVAIVVTFGAYWVGMDSSLSQSSTDWGTFGDFIGGIAGTVIALSTLIALVVALQLQAKELESTNKALAKQAQSAAQQIEDTRRYEERRIQPMLKAEWHKPARKTQLHWSIRNVGLGPCILDNIELYVKGIAIGSHDFDDVIEVIDLWSKAVAMLLDDNALNSRRTEFESVHSLKRVLAVGEVQRLVGVEIFHGEISDELVAILDEHLKAVIYFRSLAGVRLSTEVQYDELVRESEYRDLVV